MSIPVVDWVPLFLYQTSSGTCILFHSCTGLTGCRTVRHLQKLYKGGKMYALDVHSAGGGETLSEHPHPARPYTHCNENPIYVFLSWELRGLSPTFHINVSVSYLFIPRISPHTSCSRIGRSIVGIYKSLTDTWMWKLGLWPRISFLGNIYFEFSVLVVCSAMVGDVKLALWC